MRSTLKTAILTSLLVAWLTLIVILFLRASRVNFLQGFVLPGLEQFANSTQQIALTKYALDLVSALLGGALFSAACASLGLAVLRVLGLGKDKTVALCTTAFVVGEIVYSLVSLSCIVLFRLTPWLVSIMLAVGLLVGLPQAIGSYRQKPKLTWWSDIKRANRFLLAPALAVLVLGLLYTSSRLSYDSVVEYFSQAKIMASTQSAVFTYPLDPFLVSSFHPGILFTTVMEVFGDQAARVLSWANGVAILLLGMAIGAELGLTPGARLWFLALMVTTTAFVDLLGDGKVDLICTAPLVAGAYWLIRNIENPSKRTFGLIGLLFGFSIISRAFNVLLAPLFVLATYSTRWVQRRADGGFDVKKLVQSGIWMLVPMVGLGAFHIWQNWLWLGDPIAPYAAMRTVSASGWQWQFDPKMLLTYKLLYPLTITLVNSPQTLGNISPLFVGCLPLLLLPSARQGLRQRPRLVWITVAAAITLALWIAMYYAVMEIRYVFFLWLLLFLAAAQVIDAVLETSASNLRVILSAVIGFLLLFVGIRTLIIAAATYSPVDAKGQAYCYESRFCTFLAPLNTAALPGKRVFVLNAFRYYLRPDLFACSTRAQEYPKFTELAQQNSPDFWTELYRSGYRYVTYETNYANFHTHFGSLPSRSSIPNWLHVTQISASEDGLERVYAIDAVNPPFEPETYCQQDPAGIWQVKSGTPP